jgi:hypothetical protein
VFPRCFSGNCQSWGIAKARDAVLSGTRSLARTAYGSNPFMLVGWALRLLVRLCVLCIGALNYPDKQAKNKRRKKKP